MWRVNFEQCFRGLSDRTVVNSIVVDKHQIGIRCRLLVTVFICFIPSNAIPSISVELDNGNVVAEEPAWACLEVVLDQEIFG